MILLLKFWKQGLLALVISTLMYTGYAKIKSIGYNEAETKYTQIIQKYNEQVAEKLDKVEKSSNTLVAANAAANDILSRDVSTILSKVKGKTLTVVKSGECTPSTTFSDTIIQVNKRVNQSIQESQK